MATAGHELPKGVVGHGDDQADRKGQGQKRVVCDGTLFFVCLLVCGPSTRSIAFDFKGVLNQLKYVCYISVTPKSKSEQSIFEGLLKKMCASSGELKLVRHSNTSVPMDQRVDEQKIPGSLSTHCSYMGTTL